MNPTQQAAEKVLNLLDDVRDRENGKIDHREFLNAIQDRVSAYLECLDEEEAE